MSVPLRIAFSTLAFPDATLASAASLGRRWGYSGVELRLIDGELIDPSMSPADRARVKRTLAGLRVVAVDSSIRLTDHDPGPELRRFLELASDWESPLVRVFGGALAADEPARQGQLRAAARVLEAAVPLAERLGVAGRARHAPNAIDNFGACHPPCRCRRGGRRRWLLVPGPGCGGGW
jgi:sugar phosphate isomerase/epimerase